MRNKKLFAQVAAYAALFAMLVPAGNLSAADSVPTSQSAQQMIDIALVNGTLSGQFLTSSGTGLSNVSVSIEQAGQVIGQVKTNSEGVFVVSGLKNGIYEVKTLNNRLMVRAWDAAIAPPSSSEVLTLVTGDAVRGQECDIFCERDGKLCKTDIFHIVLIGAGIAGGIVGIVALTDDDNRRVSP